MSYPVGFGHVLALHLDRRGATVFAGCLRADGPGAMKLKEAGSDRMHVIQLDVTNDEQVAECVRYVEGVTDGSGKHCAVLCLLTASKSRLKTLPFHLCHNIHKV